MLEKQTICLFETCNDKTSDTRQTSFLGYQTNSKLISTHLQSINNYDLVLLQNHKISQKTVTYKQTKLGNTHFVKNHLIENQNDDQK